MMRGPQIYQKSPGFASRAASSPDSKIYLSLFSGLMIGLTLFVWLKFVNAGRPPIEDTRPTPSSANATL